MPETKLHRIQAKLFLEEGVRVSIQDVVPVFHRWIQDQSLGELLVDVANYAHVQDGPALILIAHEADYAIDFTRGRPGLQYTRKRDVPGTVSDALRQTMEQLLRAAKLLEEDSSLGFRFRTNELEVTFPDRLRVPNRIESVEIVRNDVWAVLSEIYGGDPISLESIEKDDRLPLTLMAKLPAGPQPSEILERVALSR